MYVAIIKAFDVAEVKLYEWKLAAVCLLLVRILDTNSCKGDVSRCARVFAVVLVA